MEQKEEEAPTAEEGAGDHPEETPVQEPGSASEPAETDKAVRERLEAENRELREALLRKQADFENYRRRSQREKQEAITFANRSLIADLLDVLDNLERAVQSSEENREFDAMLEGLRMVMGQLSNLLESRWGLKPIESVGKEFDPNIHEALLMEESQEHEVATIVEDFQRGYTLHEKVLRPARVKVAKPAPSESLEQSGS